MWRDYDHDEVKRDMEYAARAGFNFARVFLNYHVYVAERERFLEKVKRFVEAADGFGIAVMPIAFDLCWFGCRNETVSAESRGKCWYPSPP